VAVLAAAHPAAQAMTVSPLEAARQAGWRPYPRPSRSWPAYLALLCFVAAPFLLMVSPSIHDPVQAFSAGIAGMLLFLLGLSFLCPAIVSGASRLLGRCRGAWALERTLAADGLRRSPVRAGITVATVVISLSAIFTIAAFVHSVRGSLLAWVDQMVTADLIVSSGARTAGPRNVPLREDPALDFARIPGVQIVDLYRLIRSSYQGRPILIESFSAKRSARVRTLPMAAGDGAEALRAMAEEKGVIVSESFQSRFGVEKDDRLELATPSGAVTFDVLGVYIDYSSDVGSVLIDRDLYQRYWRDPLVDAFDLWLAPGANEAAVVQAIKERYGDRYQLFVSTHRELRDAVVNIMEQSFVVNYAVEIVAVVVAIFSVINTLLASVLDRTREIGVLRAIGATRDQLRRVIVVEAGWMGLVGAVLGLLAGGLMAYHHVAYNTKVLTGWTFQFYYPYGVAFFCLIATVFICLGAGYGPARRAASTRIVAAIGYE
ncbi:MAG TPA: ABC transporter permease, partial [Candidatus Eisenbacteria bacterium]|nr:ABC transporter permease [Candidatus Eisenbacteria bacterium]